MIAPSSQPPTITVLVVFQQRAVASWIGDCLRTTGYVVATARGYDDALRTLCITEPDAVVVTASKLDGDTEAFIGSLDRDRHASGIPTIVVAPTKSQAVLADIAARKRSRGGYLSWPLKCRELQVIIEDLLGTDGHIPDPAAGGHLVLDPPSRILRGRAGTTILGAAECRLAQYPMSQGRRSIPVEDLLTHVFDFWPGDGDPDLVRVHAASLRQKIRIVTGGRNLIRVLGNIGIVYHKGRDTAGQRPQFS
jgi:DNA-binding response OmpR family regulator